VNQTRKHENPNLGVIPMCINVKNGVATFNGLQKMLKVKKTRLNVLPPKTLTSLWSHHTTCA